MHSRAKGKIGFERIKVKPLQSEPFWLITEQTVWVSAPMHRKGIST